MHVELFASKFFKILLATLQFINPLLVGSNFVDKIFLLFVQVVKLRFEFAISPYSVFTKERDIEDENDDWYGPFVE